MITIDRESFNQENIDLDILKQVLSEHISYCEQRDFNKKEDYYNGKHLIFDAKTKKRKANINILKLVTSQLSSYALGNGVKLKHDTEDLTNLTDLFKKSNTDKVDITNAKNASIFGETFELAFIDEDEQTNEVILKFKSIDPRNCFIVYDTCLEHHALFGVYYYTVTVNKNTYYYLYVITKNYIYRYKCHNSLSNFELLEQNENILGQITLYQIQNNDDLQGDWEQQMSLQDSINDIISDLLRSSDLEVDRIVVLSGSLINDDQAKKLKREQKILTLPIGADAKILQFQAGAYTEKIELIKYLNKLILTLSYVPTLDREDTATINAASGIAIEMAYQTTELVTKQKELYYNEALRKRVQIANNFLNLHNKGITDIDGIEFVYSRTKPHNLPEIVSMVAALEGVVTDNTRLSLLPFVKDLDSELTEIEKQKEENLKKEQEFFMNTPYLSEEEGEEKVV